MTAALRDGIRQAVDAQSYGLAAALLARLMREQPTASTASYVVARFTELRAYLPLTRCRVAVARSFTVEPVIPLLRARCFAAGIDATVHVGDFNAYAREVLDPASSLYQFAPDILILAVRTADVVPGLWYDAADLSAAEMDRVVERTLADFASWIETFRRCSAAHLILHDLETPAHPVLGVLEAQQTGGPQAAIGRLNQGLRDLARQHPGVYVLDYDGLVARHGRLRWHDERKWLTMRMPIAADGLIHLADEYMRFMHPLTGRVCKALVVDLDNTLWGGVVGEDGLGGVQLGVEYPGATYRACQRAILDLYQRGVILGICSKNDPAEALAVLETHPDMLLRPRHFAARRINWADKAQNLSEIAAELNIGLDALAFLDDSPVEREWVRSRAPDVYVIELPADPTLYAQTLRECPVFERLALSDEDKRRGEHYAARHGRAELQQAATSVEEFHHSLDMTAEIAGPTPLTLARIAQLTQKTNQFNLTTRRYTDQELREMVRDPGVRILSLQLRDRFGDSGIVGVAIARVAGAVWEIDAFLLSCRAIGRGVETALLASVAQQARQTGAQRLLGWYRPTAKNGSVRDFYPAHRFMAVTEQDGSSLWTFDLGQDGPAPPPWIACRSLDADSVLCQSP
jgi:FkbH-like protein